MNSCFGPLSHSFLGTSRATESSTQTERLEVLQDLDLYFIRQIAHSLQEYGLEQKIDLEIKMREGTTKLLAACKHPTQSLEAAKSLLTSNERMNSYMSELQYRNTEDYKLHDNVLPLVSRESCKARVAISDMRIPLIWKDTDYFKNKGDYRRFAVFCLLRIGTEICDTVLINNVDRNMTDLSFEDVIVFNHVPNGFEFKLEIYSHVLQNDLSIASTPRKIKKKISNSISRTIGKKLAASLKDELNSVAIGPQFHLVAHATLCLDDVSNEIRTHDLITENLDNPLYHLPLFGHFCCRLAAQPDCMTDEVISGYLNITQKVGNACVIKRLYCILRNFQLSFWSDNEACDTLPVMTIPVHQNTKLKLDANVSSFPHSFKIINTSHGKSLEHILELDNDSDYVKWTTSIRQHSQDNKLWGKAAEFTMDISSPIPFRASAFHKLRQGSLYDSTPFTDSPPSNSSSSSNSVLHEYNNRKSPPLLRSRSSSISSASSSVSSSQRNFFKFHKRNKDLSFC